MAIRPTRLLPAAVRRRLLPAPIRRWLGRSLAHRIALLGAALAAVFVLLAGVASYALTRAYVLAGAQAELDGRAMLVSDRLGGALTSIENDIGGLSRSSLVTNALVDSSGRGAYLQPFLRDHELPAGTAHRLALADYAGRVVAANRAGGGYGAAPWWPALLEREQRHAELRGGPEPVLLLAYPVLFAATRRPEGALVLELPLRPLLAQAAGEVPDGDAVEFRSGGEVLARAARTGTPADGRAIAAVHAVGAPAALEVRVVRSRASALAPMGLLLVVHAVGGLVALLVAGAVAWGSARWLTAPVQALSRAAEAVTQAGVASIRFEAAGEDEPAQLARSLQHMLERLRAAQEGLEVRVAERTAELEFAESRLRAVLEHMLDGLVTIDEAGRIESFNRSAERIFGWGAAEVVGRDVGCLMGEPHRSAHAGYVARYLRTGERHVVGTGREVTAVRRDGTPFPLELLVSEFHFRGRRVFVALVRDITARREMDRMKSEFVSVVSHELRTPLTSIRGALGLLAGGVVGPLSPEAGRLTRIATENSTRLGRLIDDLLDVQRIEADAVKLDLAPAPVERLLADARELNQAFARRLGVEIVRTGPELPAQRLRVDADRFQQVMSNLLSNACKYSPAGAEVELSAGLEGRGWVRIAVRDRGPGIPLEFRERIFQKFSQADASSSRAREGTGLGLAIAKGLVERMSGEIGFSSEPGAGTTFHVAFPAAEAARGDVA